MDIWAAAKKGDLDKCIELIQSSVPLNEYVLYYVRFSVV